MKTNIKFIVAALGVGVAVVWLTGCHHLGGGWCCAPSSAPAATATTPPPGNPATPSAAAQPNAPTGHQH